MICPNKAHDTVKMNGVDLDGNWVCPKCRLVLADKPPVPALDRDKTALAILQTLLAKAPHPPESNSPRKTVEYAVGVTDLLIKTLAGQQKIAMCPHCGFAGWQWGMPCAPDATCKCQCGWKGPMSALFGDKPKQVGEFKCEHPTCNNSAVCKLSWTQSGRAISQYLCAYHNGLHLADLSAVHRAGKGSISGLEHV